MLSIFTNIAHSLLCTQVNLLSIISCETHILTRPYHDTSVAAVERHAFFYLLIFLLNTSRYSNCSTSLLSFFFRYASKIVHSSLSLSVPFFPSLDESFCSLYSLQHEVALSQIQQPWAQLNLLLHNKEAHVSFSGLSASHNLQLTVGKTAPLLHLSCPQRS